ncbi:FAD-dependent oxidoreductase [Solihabitans fulvus]|nr:FAD-dependent oxidoreductase [Solihabitans fulvus]
MTGIGSTSAARSAVVVGAGICGLTSAAALAGRGWRVTILERAKDLAGIQTAGALHLWTNAMLALRRLGLAEAVEAVGLPIEQTEYRDHRGRVLATWPVGRIAREHGVTDLALGRKDLHDALARAALDRPGVRLHLGVECTGATQDDTGVLVTLDDGRTLAADLLVAADGIRSGLRAALVAPTQPRYSGYGQWQAVLDRDHAAGLLPVGVERIMFGRGRRAVVHHVRGGRLLWEGILYGPPGRAALRERKSLLLRELAAFAGPVLAAIEATAEGDIDAQDVYDLPPLNRWSTGRITLLGDAAHAMTTNLSQGACQGIEDADVLSECLARVPDIPEALAEYQRRRLARITPLARRSRRVAGIGGLSGPLSTGVRDFVMARALSTVALRDHRNFVAAMP